MKAIWEWFWKTWVGHIDPPGWNRVKVQIVGILRIRKYSTLYQAVLTLSRPMPWNYLIMWLHLSKSLSKSHTFITTVFTDQQLLTLTKPVALHRLSAVITHHLIWYAAALNIFCLKMRINWYNPWLLMWLYTMSLSYIYFDLLINASLAKICFTTYEQSKH